MKLILRDRRQITLPEELCRELGVGPGDRLEARVENGVLNIRPSRQVALDALKAIGDALREAGVTEEEFLESGRQIRTELFRENFPELAKKYGV